MNKLQDALMAFIHHYVRAQNCMRTEKVFFSRCINLNKLRDIAILKEDATFIYA